MPKLLTTGKTLCQNKGMSTHHPTTKESGNTGGVNGKENPMETKSIDTTDMTDYRWKWDMVRTSAKLTESLDKMNEYASETYEIGYSQLETLIETQERVRQLAVLHRHVGRLESLGAPDPITTATEIWTNDLKNKLIGYGTDGTSTNPMSNAIDAIKRGVWSRLYREYSGDQGLW